LADNQSTTSAEILLDKLGELVASIADLKSQKKDILADAGRLLRESRKQRGVTLRKMATGLGVSAPYLHDIESGHRGFSEGFLERLSDYLEAERRAASEVTQ
jgi:ribosome-binding protein aMBF1 (putative translation factor)